MRCKSDTQAGTGSRISKTIAGRFRYFGRGFFAAALDIGRIHYSVAAQQAAAVKSKPDSHAIAHSVLAELSMPKAPVRVAVTGAAGQIGYSVLFRIASGEMLGSDQPVIVQMLEIPDEKAQKALKGVMMELEDCAFPLLADMVAASDPMAA